MNLIEALNTRYATKKFDSTKKLDQAIVDQLIEALRLTPTTYGLQLMKAVLVEDEKIREELVQHSYGQAQVKDASHLIVLCRESNATAEMIDQYIQTISETRTVPLESLEGFKKMMQGSILNLPEDKCNLWMEKQVYIALGNLMTACAVLGIDACPMEGFNPAAYDETLGLDKLGLKSVLAIPVGFHAEDCPNLHNKKVRRSTADFLIKI